MLLKYIKLNKQCSIAMLLQGMNHGENVSKHFVNKKTPP